MIHVLSTKRLYDKDKVNSILQDYDTLSKLYEQLTKNDLSLEGRTSKIVNICGIMNYCKKEDFTDFQKFKALYENLEELLQNDQNREIFQNYKKEFKHLRKI